jgi:hypothetical protein
MTKEGMYGFPCVENPHDFTPDEECCTPEEISFWEASKKRWDAGERDVRGTRCQSVRDADGELIAHFTMTSWGIGVNMVEMDEDDSEDFDE